MLFQDKARILLGGFFSSLGLPSLSASPARVQIKHEKRTPGTYDGEVEVVFNPNSLSSSTNVSWKTINLAVTSKARAYALQYASTTSPATLSFDLTIDTYEGDPTATSGWGDLLSLPNPTALHIFTPPTGVSVQPYIEEIARLQRVALHLHRPPICQVWWGQLCLVEGPLTGLTQKLTRFLPDGTPVRAQLGLTFTDAAIHEEEPFSNDVQKTYTSRLGDTLQAIAAREYGDPARWRLIAEANDIDDPRALAPGTVLVIPAIR